MAQHLNVLFILSDQHQAKVLGHAGHPLVKTPHLDRFAAEGVRFGNAVCSNPICTPSRVSFLSGQYPHNHGYYGLEGPNPGGLPTLPGVFRAAGYRTGAIGKIHCPEYWMEDDCDVFMDVSGNSILGMAPKREAYIKEKGLRKYPYYEVSHDGCPALYGYRDSDEGWVVSESIAFMRESIQAGKPFFLHASFPKPHQPYTPAQEFWDMYPDEDLVMPGNFSYDMRAGRKAPYMILESERHQARTNWFVEPKTYAAAARRKLRGYLGSVSQVDHAVGELLDFLKESGLGENTIVVYSSDHGDYVCEHGLMEKAPGICSDAITRIPMIWRVPGLTKAGLKVDAIVEATDVFPTLCELAGVQAPPTTDGKDLSGLLAGKPGQPHAIGVTEFAFSKSVRKGKYRLVYYPKWFFEEDYPEGFGELYDLEADPWEMQNLFFDADKQETVRELQADLLDWLVSTSRPRTVLQAVKMNGPGWVTRYANSVTADGKLPPDLFRNRSMMDRLRM